MAVTLRKHLMHSGDPLCDIIDKSGVMLCLTTYEKDIPRIKAGDGLVFHGSINYPCKVFYSMVITGILVLLSIDSRKIIMYLCIKEEKIDCTFVKQVNFLH